MTQHEDKLLESLDDAALEAATGGAVEDILLRGRRLPDSEGLPLSRPQIISIGRFPIIDRINPFSVNPNPRLLNVIPKDLAAILAELDDEDDGQLPDDTVSM